MKGNRKKWLGLTIILMVCLTILVACQTNPEKVETNQDRIEYLQSYGWEVSQEPLATQEILVPEDTDESYDDYLALQREQGFDLTKYAGKRVKRYIYEVLNYPTGETGVQANLLIYGDVVIGGEVLSPHLDGFLHGLAMPSDGAADTSSDASDTSNDDYFADARLNRQQARDDMLSVLQDAVEQDEMMRSQLDDFVQTMTHYTVTEIQTEELVISKGYTDCVAFISENNISLAVSAPIGGLTQEDNAEIVDLVRQITGFSTDQISIIEVEG